MQFHNSFDVSQTKPKAFGIRLRFATVVHLEDMWYLFCLESGTIVSHGEYNSFCFVAEIDTDGDFLPDVVEWVVLTDSTNPDTDGDNTPDFVEVVEGGNPRFETPPMPADQQMRLVVTGPTPGIVLSLATRASLDAARFS